MTRLIGAGGGCSSSTILSVLILLQVGQQSLAGNLWQQIAIPPYIPCSLPQCDSLCEQLETVDGEICPRTASTNLKVYGEIPLANACEKQLRNWVSGPKPSAEDPDGCGPCLLAEEKSRCNINSGDGRGFNAGGPPPRSGHSMTRYVTPIRSAYVGATVFIVFGGVDKDKTFLNDVWWFCVDNCPLVLLNKRTYTPVGIAEDYTYCPPGNCMWEEKGIQQEFIDWITYKEPRPSSLLRRGIVPSRPSGRQRHTAVISETLGEDGDSLTDVMAVFGGLSPNCSNYCEDYWYYDIMQNWWVMVYGEWYGITKEREQMWDYAALNQQAPGKRWNHAAVHTRDWMFMWGGHGGSDAAACCGYDARRCESVGDTTELIPDDEGCGYEYDLWATNLKEYTPFETKISVGKHATQSSTLGTGVARLAVDGNRNGIYSDTWENSVTLTNSDSQAWWQVDLGGPMQITNVTIFNRADAFSERLQNFYVLFSTVPLLSDRLQDLLEDPLVHKVHFMYLEDTGTMYLDRMAQYVRVQLAGTNYLSLAEVEIWGHAPVESWQHIEGMKRWSNLYSVGDFPIGRMGASFTMVSEQTALLFGGFVQERPYFLDDFWTVLLPGPDKFNVPVAWSFLEPKKRAPDGILPWARYGHSALYSEVCSIGYDIEKLAREGQIVLTSLAQGELPVHVYPGNPESDPATPWCRGQVAIFGGSSTAETDPLHPAHPEGYLNDLWLVNMSSQTVSQVIYDEVAARPPPRRDHGAAIDRDFLYIFGGTSNECQDYICGDMWVYNVSGPNSCPNDCSGHGVCEWGFCICDPGFKAADCSGMNCPQAVCTYNYADHFLDCLECSNQGTCSSNGTCICDSGFKGEACEVLSCPGSCSGHGTCKLGGICDCDENYGGPDCFIRFCPGNCTRWGVEGIDTGQQGDCVIVRSPPCCGDEPTCENTINSPLGCIERAAEFIPNHNVTATCVCADTYTGDDCGQTIADSIIDVQNANFVKTTGGCFSRNDHCLVFSSGEYHKTAVGSVKAGDLVASMDENGTLVASPLLYVHDHPDPATTYVLHLQITSEQTIAVEMTEWHIMPTAVCSSGFCMVDTYLAARDIDVGNMLLVQQNQSFEVAVVTRIRKSHGRVRYLVSANDHIVVNGVLGSCYSTYAGSWETLPFKALHWIWPSGLSHPAVAAALTLVLESPVLRVFERSVNWFGSGRFRGPLMQPWDRKSAPTVSEDSNSIQ